MLAFNKWYSASLATGGFQARVRRRSRTRCNRAALVSLPAINVRDNVSVEYREVPRWKR